MLEGQTITAAALKPLLHYSDRLELEAAVEAIIAELDQRDPDPDLEDGEHLSAHVDAFGRELHYHTLADQVPEDDADGGDRAWQEWDARAPKARRHAQHEPIGGFASREDDEDDDALEQDDEPEDDGTAEAEPDREGMTYPEYHDRQPDTLCHPDAGDDQEPDGQEIWNAHRRRIRRTRCRHTPTAPHPYQLMDRNGWRVIKGGWA